MAKPENVTIVSIDAATGNLIAANNLTAAQSLRRHPMASSGVQAESSRRGLRNYNEFEYKNSGPYRRVRTYGNSSVQPGATRDFTYAYADVVLHCNNGNVKLSSGYNGAVAYDSGHAYLGGWNNSGSSVDAGLQYNFQTNPAAGDTYTPFLRTDHYIYDFYDRTTNQKAPYPNPNISGTNYHIACNARSMVRISYSIQGTSQTPYGYPDNGTLMIASFNYNDSSGAYHVIDISLYGQSQSTVFGYSPDCPGCKLKMMTSIAQADPAHKGNQRDAFSDGDFFRAEWHNAHVSCGLRQNGCFGLPGSPSEAWWDTYATEGCTEHPSWSFPNYDTGRNGCGNTPTDKFHEVQVSNFTFGGEDDYIDLAPKVLQPTTCSGYGWRRPVSVRQIAAAYRCPSSGGAVTDGYACSPDDPACDTGTDCNLIAQTGCNPPYICDSTDPSSDCYVPPPNPPPTCDDPTVCNPCGRIISPACRGALSTRPEQPATQGAPARRTPTAGS